MEWRSMRNISYAVRHCTLITCDRWEVEMPPLSTLISQVAANHVGNGSWDF